MTLGPRYHCHHERRHPAIHLPYSDSDFLFTWVRNPLASVPHVRTSRARTSPYIGMWVSRYCQGLPDIVYSYQLIQSPNWEVSSGKR